MADSADDRPRWSRTHTLVLAVFSTVALSIFGFAWYARNFSALLRLLDREEAGDQELRDGRLSAAEAEYRRALDIGRKLAGRDARDVRFRELLPGLHARLGEVALRRQDPAGAGAACKTAADLLGALPQPTIARLAQDPKQAPHLDFCKNALSGQ